MAELEDAMLVVVELESGISVARQKKRTNKPLQVQVLLYSQNRHGRDYDKLFRMYAYISAEMKNPIVIIGFIFFSLQSYQILQVLRLLVRNL